MFLIAFAFALIVLTTRPKQKTVQQPGTPMYDAQSYGIAYGVELTEEAATVAEELARSIDVYVTSSKRSISQQVAAMAKKWARGEDLQSLYAADVSGIVDAFPDIEAATIEAEKIAEKLSRHLVGRAIDIRKNATLEEVSAAVGIISTVNNPEVIEETDHFHIEWD